MAAVELMIPDGPTATLVNNMNTLYITFNTRSQCNKETAGSIKIAYSGWDEDGPNPALDYQSYIIPIYTLNYLHKEEGIPDFHYKIDMINENYKIEFTYIYEFYTNPEVDYEIYSKVTQYYINNTIPTLCSTTSSGLIQAELTTELKSRDDFTIFYNASMPLLDCKINDIQTTLDGLSIRQIKEINQDKLIFKEPKASTMKFTRYILEHESISRIVRYLIPITAQGDQEIKFICEFNFIRYQIYLKGNFAQLRG